MTTAENPDITSTLIRNKPIMNEWIEKAVGSDNAQ